MTTPGQSEEAKAGEARDMRLLSDGQILGMTISLGDTEDHTFCDGDVAQLLSHAHAQRAAIAALTRKVAELEVARENDTALLREIDADRRCIVWTSENTPPSCYARLAARLRDSRAGGGEAT